MWRSNGLVVSWHRSLKAALKACLTDRWRDVLSLVLPGLYSVSKELQSTIAELVYGGQLRLSDEIFQLTKLEVNVPEFLRNLLRCKRYG